MGKAGLDSATLTQDEIEKWCLTPANGKRAVQLGRDLMALNANPKAKLPSRGADEDAIIKWAAKNPVTAKAMFWKLMPKLAKYA